MKVPSSFVRRWRFTKGLRFRLTLTYIAFFTALLSFLGVFFHQTLASLYDSQLHHILNEEWAAVRGYLRIEKGENAGSTIVKILTKPSSWTGCVRSFF